MKLSSAVTIAELITSIIIGITAVTSIINWTRKKNLQIIHEEIEQSEKNIKLYLKSLFAEYYCPLQAEIKSLHRDIKKLENNTKK